MRMKPATCLVLILLACLAFLPGLNGPFLLDDLPNLEGIQEWAMGTTSLWHLLSHADAGPLGRPLSLLSFAATVATSGLSPAAFKATNLFLHLLNGLLAGALLLRLFRHDRALSTWPPSAAWICAAAWTLLPLHVPTVLYAVQRMTLLSATFTLLALLAWVVARERFARGGRATLLLWIGVPLLTALAALSKENGLLVPLFCLVLEFTLFTPSGTTTARPRQVTWFFRVSVLLPMLLGVTWMATHPGFVLDGYQDRPFTLAQRLLSEPRAVWEYAYLTFVPDAARLGLYQDTFATSTGIWSPVTTGLALLGWLAVIAWAVAWRRRCPGFAAGIGLFLAGHLMEGSVFALELFFVHRNYLPSLGLLLAIASLASYALGQARTPIDRRLLPGLVAALLLAYGLTTASRAWTWGDMGRLLTHELRVNPDSVRLRSDLAAQAMQAGRPDLALVHLDSAEHFADPDERRAVRLWRVLAYCTAGQPTPATVLASLADGEARRVTPYTMRALETLATQAEGGNCKPLPGVVVPDAASAWLQRAPQSTRSAAIWKSRYAIARLYASVGDLPHAEAAAVRAFDDSGHAFPVGVLAFQLAASLGDRARCEKIYTALSRVPSSGDPREAQALESFGRFLRRP